MYSVTKFHRLRSAAMCYFARTDYVCGDWKWGNMMERCPRQHRIGETCGAKLVHTDYITKNSDKCKTCQDIDVKYRRLAKVEDSIRRWTPEKEKFAASLAKANAEAHDLRERLKAAHSRRQSVQFRNSEGGNNGSSSFPTPYRSDSYSYSSQNQTYPASSQMSSGYSSVEVSSPSTSTSSGPYSPSTARLTPYSSRR